MNESHEALVAIATDPMAALISGKADDPFCFLLVALSKGYQDEGDDFITHLP